MDKQRSGSRLLRHLLVAICVAIGAAGMTHAHAEAPLVASGHPDYPPFTWRHGDRIIGIGAELTELIFSDLGIKLEFRPRGNWKRVQAETEHGSIDVIVGIYKTDDRRQYLAYPDIPYIEDVNVVWVSKGREFPFRKWEDLIGKRGTAMLGESYGEEFDRFIRDKLYMERVPTPLQNLMKLEAERSDYYPFSLHGGQIQVKRFGFEGRVHHLPGVISKEGVYIAISRKSRLARYLPQLTEAIRQRRDDGTVARLERKYVELAASTADGH